MNAGQMSVLVVSVAVAAWVGVAVVRRYALGRLLDLPNERSSHERPTPRGGGLGLTLAYLGGILVAAALGHVQGPLAAALAGGGSLVALVGFLDDHGHLRPSARLLSHLLAAAWAVAWLGGLPAVDFGWGPVDLGWAGTALLLLYLVWFLNLFNFMDGIDGMAGAQAIAMSVIAAVLLSGRGAPPEAALPLVLLAAATAGFLIWNWPPARIFMGDVGSGFLGYTLGALALWTVGSGWLTPWVWLILGGAFLADATVTLLTRARYGAALTQAHRSHAYQRLSRHWQGHRPVTLAFTLVNAAWLGPWAWAAARWPEHGAACALVALVPLFVAAASLGAGRPGEIA